MFGEKMKILILGKDGMAGSMLTSYLQKKYDVIAYSRKDFDVLKDELPNFKEYDYVINCIGLIKQKTVEDVLLFYKINSEFPHHLAANFNRVIHLSSDCVFSGKLNINKSYGTLDVKDAEDDYGKSKARGEPRDAMVLRTSIIGPSSSGLGLFEWLRQTPEKSVEGFVNHGWCGLTTSELAKTIDIIISNNLYQHGVFQLTGTNISKYDLLCLINKIFNLGKDINLVNAKENINRTLLPSYQCQEIEDQLEELKIWMDNEVS